MNKILALALAISLSLCSPGLAKTVYVTNSPGGVIVQFESKYKRIARNGSRLVINGYCNSACTLFLRNVPLDRVCMMPGSSLGFHSGSVSKVRGGVITDSVYSPGATKFMWDHYPESVRRAIRERGWDGTTQHEEVISVPHTRLAGIIRTCK